MYVCMYVYLYVMVCMHVRLYVHMLVCMYVCMYAYACMHASMYVCMDVWIYVVFCDSPTVEKNSSPEKKKQNTRWRSKVISSRAAERMELLGAELSPTLRSGWARSVKTLVLVLKCLRNWLKKLVLA